MHNKETIKFTKSAQQGGDKAHNKKTMKFTRNAHQGGNAQ
jgi:hypothetical protein